MSTQPFATPATTKSDLDTTTNNPSGTSSKGLKFERYFTKEGLDPFDMVEWERRDAIIKNAEGEIVFEKKNVEVPKSWSQNATNIAASHYLYGDHETSVRQWIDRVAGTIAEWGLKDGYFANSADAKIFYDELAYLMVSQHLAFNSPVNYNCGVFRYDKTGEGGRYYWDKETQTVKETTNDYEHPQCSACFILGVDDSMQSILDTAKAEAVIFKFGSGSGMDMSKLRSSKERIRGKGYSSGPVTFMKGFDAFAGVIKSGGKTRRAAKMVILQAEHPDVEEFIWCKVKEERKAHTLIEAGYDPALDGEIYNNIFYQNANNSVLVTDEFMKAAIEGGTWQTRYVTNGEVCETKDARDLLRQMAAAAWECGDPGLQYDTTIQNWHTCANTDKIYATNPCSEYVFLDDTACNLASFNLMKFRNDDGTFDIDKFSQGVKRLITAMEILVDNSAYPTPKIAERSHIFRTLGIGYANLGSLLMSMGLPYDSDEGRAYAAAITAVLTGESYKQSAKIAEQKGAFPGYAQNREPFQKVMKQHSEAAKKIDNSLIPGYLFDTAVKVWEDVVNLTEQHGARNAQASVLAPTGTIGFVMDANTTGIEPAIALVAYKKMVGGGYMKIVNETVPMALRTLGYNEEEITKIIKHLEENDTIENAPGIKEEHLAVFDCAFKAANGERSIHHLGHIKMMGATQPFLSGAISKTVNLPESATIEDAMDAYIEGWKNGLKAIAIYRDGSKKSQPLNTKNEGKGAKATTSAAVTEDQPSPQPVYANGKANGAANGAAKANGNGALHNLVLQSGAEAVAQAGTPQRKRLPDERLSLTHKFDISGHEGYITVGLYPNGMPGELFVTMSKQGSTISGLMDAFATSISLGLQYGVPLEVLVNKFSHMRFEPAGFTKNKQIPMVKSIMDYIFRWMAVKFLDSETASQVHSSGAGNDAVDNMVDLAAAVAEKQQEAPKVTAQEVASVPKPDVQQSALFTFQNQTDAPGCHYCGAIMVRSGSCYKCIECGSSSGCS